MLKYLLAISRKEWRWEMLFTLVSYFIAYCVGSVFCCCCIHSSSVFVNTFVSKRNEDFLYELNSNCKVPVMSYRGTVCVRMINLRLWFFLLSLFFHRNCIFRSIFYYCTLTLIHAAKCHKRLSCFEK